MAIPLTILASVPPIIGLILVSVACCGGGVTTVQQQQQQSSDGEPKRICPECGLENPRDADYCGDCGFKFGPSE